MAKAETGIATVVLAETASTLAEGPIPAEQTSALALAALKITVRSVVGYRSL